MRKEEVSALFRVEHLRRQPLLQQVADIVYMLVEMLVDLLAQAGATRHSCILPQPIEGRAPSTEIVTMDDCPAADCLGAE